MLGFGSDLHSAVEDANQWLLAEIKYDDVECYDNVHSHVDGVIYWAATELVISAYKLNQQ